jgi:hypothetical protein
MPAIGLLDELISGIEPIFVTRHDRWQSKHPTCSIHRSNEEADPLKEECRKRIRKTWRKPLGAVTNLLITNKQVQEKQKG